MNWKLSSNNNVGNGHLSNIKKTLFHLSREKFSEVKHYLIQQCPLTGYFYMSSQEMFPTIEQLIKHYQKNKEHLITKLVYVPCPANWIQSFSKSKTLGLCKGNSAMHVMLIH